MIQTIQEKSSKRTSQTKIQLTNPAKVSEGNGILNIFNFRFINMYIINYRFGDTNQYHKQVCCEIRPKYRHTSM
jgi:hypothetical protein